MAPKRKSQLVTGPQQAGPAPSPEVDTTPSAAKGTAAGVAASGLPPAKPSTAEPQPRTKNSDKGPGPSTTKETGNDSTSIAEAGKSDLILLPEFDLVDCFPIRIPLPSDRLSSSGAAGSASASAGPRSTPPPNPTGRSSGGGAAVSVSDARSNPEKPTEAAGAAKGEPSQSHFGAPSTSCIIGRMTQELYWGVFRLPRLSRAQIAVWMTESSPLNLQTSTTGGAAPDAAKPSAGLALPPAVAGSSTAKPLDRPVEVVVHVMCLGRTPSRILRLNGTVEYLPHGVTTVLGLHDVVELLPGSCPLRLCQCPIGTPIPRSVSDVVDMVLAHHSATLQEQWSQALLAAATAAASNAPLAAGITNALSSTQQLFPIVPRETPPALAAGEASQAPYKSQAGRKQPLLSGPHLTAASFSLPDFSQSSLIQLRTAAATSKGDKPRSYREAGDSPDGKALPPHQLQPHDRKRQREDCDEAGNDQGTPTLRAGGGSGKGCENLSSSPHGHEVEVQSQDSFGELELIVPSGNHTLQRPKEKGVVKKANEFRLEDALDQAEREQAHALVHAPVPLPAGRPTNTRVDPRPPLPEPASIDTTATKLPITHVPQTKDRFPTLGGYGNLHNGSTKPNPNANASAKPQPLLHASFALESQVVSYNND